MERLDAGRFEMQRVDHVSANIPFIRTSWRCSAIPSLSRGFGLLLIRGAEGDCTGRRRELP